MLCIYGVLPNYISLWLSHKFHYAVQKNPTELNIAMILIERAGMQAAYGKTYVLLNI